MRHRHQGKQLSRTASQAVGYREVLDHLAGKCDLEETIRRVKVRTRRFAKRQRTWFRGFPRRGIDVTRIAADDGDALLCHRLCGDS